MTTTAPVEDAAPVAAQDAADVVEEDLLVEDISIDGMCGVY
jgi:mycofactocin precursor